MLPFVNGCVTIPSIKKRLDICYPLFEDEHSMRLLLLTLGMTRYEMNSNLKVRVTLQKLSDHSGTVSHD